MTISRVAVNYASLFANGTLTAGTTGTSWQNEVRVADYFINRIATTAGTPSGLSWIKVDQGATVANYVSPNRIIIPALHNLDAALTLEYNSSDSWPGTPVTLSDDTPTSGELYSATFTKVTGAAENQWWRLSFTKTDEALEVPEVWLTEKVILGQSESGSEDYNIESPAELSIAPNLLVQRTREGVRSAVQLGSSLRSLTLIGNLVSASSYADWAGLIDGVDEGLRPLFVDDPVGALWFAEMELRKREVTKNERWNLEIALRELP